MLDNIWPFLFFVVAMTGTPGPGNLTMMAMGQAAGLRSAIPFLCGALIGLGVLCTLVASGLGELFLASPTVALIMRMAGIAYIVYLAVKILRMQLHEPEERRSLTFVEGLFFHPVNPKSWAMSVVGVSQFTDPASPYWSRVGVFVLIFLVGMLVFHSLWCAAGAALPRLFHSRGLLAGLNTVMVGLMVGATVYALFI